MNASTRSTPIAATTKPAHIKAFSSSGVKRSSLSTGNSLSLRRPETDFLRRSSAAEARGFRPELQPAAACVNAVDNPNQRIQRQDCADYPSPPASLDDSP